METPTIDIIALDKARAEGKLRQGNWGNGKDAVCMMSALVPGASSVDACVTAGWPAWLASVNIRLFDKAPDIETAYQFAHDVALACIAPVDFDKARDLFLIAVLSKGDHSALASLDKRKSDSDHWKDSKLAVDTVVALLHRRLAGEDVEGEMQAARKAAAEAAAAEAAAEAWAWAAAAAAAAAAAWAAAWAAAAEAAAEAWAEAAEAAAEAARRSARAEQRQHLIDALRQAVTL